MSTETKTIKCYIYPEARAEYHSVIKITDVMSPYRGQYECPAATSRRGFRYANE